MLRAASAIGTAQRRRHLRPALRDHAAPRGRRPGGRSAGRPARAWAAALQAGADGIREVGGAEVGDRTMSTPCPRRRRLDAALDDRRRGGTRCRGGRSRRPHGRGRHGRGSRPGWAGPATWATGSSATPTRAPRRWCSGWSRSPRPCETARPGRPAPAPVAGRGGPAGRNREPASGRADLGGRRRRGAAAARPAADPRAGAAQPLPSGHRAGRSASTCSAPRPRRVRPGRAGGCAGPISGCPPTGRVRGAGAAGGLASGRPADRVEIACCGGRGRTGTALACLAVLDGVPAARGRRLTSADRYDRRAVETPWQRRYVRHFSATRPEH